MSHSKNPGAALRAARSGRREPETVLDRLLAGLDGEAADLALRWLLEEGGARPLLDRGQVDVDDVRALLGAETGLLAVVVRFCDETEPRVALADPWDDEAIRAVQRKLGSMPLLACASGVVLAQLASGRVPQAAVARAPQGVTTRISDVASFVDDCIRTAFVRGASDVHFEAVRDGIVVRSRLNGVMIEHARSADAQQSPEIISRIKVMAQLDITECRIPQDGRFRASVPGGEIDLRVSVIPNLFGEGAVLRLLDKAHLRLRDQTITLRGLGFEDRLVPVLQWLGGLPHGMVLVTGPTGSGKTTTVYAMMSETNRSREKIITIEDPVEYELEGVLQIPVNEKKGLSFATGLRSILRHDPDRILVGEIRDPETAEIAVQSALTGHQVLTTVHANSIVDVFGRFRHFAIDMYGFMSALNGVVVQRLVRTLCSACVQKVAPEATHRQWLATRGIHRAPTVIAQPQGCDACQGSGFGRRTVIAAVHVVDDRLRDMVTSSAPLADLRGLLSTHEGGDLAAAAARMVASGTTTIDEVDRVLGVPIGA